MEKKKLTKQKSFETVPTTQITDTKEQQIGNLKEEIHSLASLIQAMQEHVPEPQDQQIANLREEMRSLVALVQTKKEHGARNILFDNTMAELRDLKSLVKDSMSAIPTELAKDANSHPCSCASEEEAGCLPCQCVSAKCCCYDIHMTHFRVVHMQSAEPMDTNALPTDELELRFFASIDQINNIGSIIPNPTGYVTGRKGLLEPVGVWVPVYRNIGTKCLTKGSKATVTIELIITEVETPLESVVFNRDEYGSASESFTLDCCYNSYSPIIITVALTGGGIDVAPAVIEAKFSVVKKC